MSLYNMVNGVNQATFFVLPMLDKHPDEYPRFRDCFVSQEGNIQVLTRTGGGNRPDYEEENNTIKAMPGYIKDYDWKEDNTYAVWEFQVPEQWQSAFDTLMAGNIRELPNEYIDQMIKVYPKLKEQFERLKS